MAKMLYLIDWQKVTMTLFIRGGSVTRFSVSQSSLGACPRAMVNNESFSVVQYSVCYSLLSCVL